MVESTTSHRVATPGLPVWVRESLRCPACHGELQDAAEGAGLLCPAACGPRGLRRRFPVTDGIPVLLLDDAELLPDEE